MTAGAAPPALPASPAPGRGPGPPRAAGRSPQRRPAASRSEQGRASAARALRLPEPAGPRQPFPRPSAALTAGGGFSAAGRTCLGDTRGCGAPQRAHHSPTAAAGPARSARARRGEPRGRSAAARLRRALTAPAGPPPPALPPPPPPGPALPPRSRRRSGPLGRPRQTEAAEPRAGRAPPRDRAAVTRRAEGAGLAPPEALRQGPGGRLRPASVRAWPSFPSRCPGPLHWSNTSPRNAGALRRWAPSSLLEASGQRSSPSASGWGRVEPGQNSQARTRAEPPSWPSLLHKRLCRPCPGPPSAPRGERRSSGHSKEVLLCGN